MAAKTPQRVKKVTRATTTVIDLGGATRRAKTEHKFLVILDGNITTLNAKNMRDGDRIAVYLKQDATGSRTVGFGTMFLFSGGAAPTVTATANKTSKIEGVYVSALGKFLCDSALNF